MDVLKPLAAGPVAPPSAVPPCPDGDPGDSSGAVSHERPTAEGASASVIPPSMIPPSRAGYPRGRTSAPPRPMAEPPPSSSLISRPMTVPPLEAPPEQDDLDEEELLALR